MKSRQAGAKIVDAATLVAISLLVYAAQRFGEGSTSSSMAAALGYLLLAATLAGNLVEIAKLPHLTGYLAAGVIVGPHGLSLVSRGALADLSPANTLALALIALAGGAELRVDALRRGLRTLGVATVVQSLVGIVLCGGALALMRSYVPFLAELPISAVVGASLLWGVLSISRSPSAVLAILSQTRARGTLTDWTLAFVMSSDVVVVVLLAAATSAARPLIQPGASFSLEAFTELGHELLGSVSLGTTLGLVLAAYVRAVGRQLLVVLLLLGFGMSEVLAYLRLDAPLCFLVAGFVVQNLSRQGDKFLHAVEETGAVVYVVFFALAGANLDVPLLKTLWPVALGLCLVRAAVTWGSARWAGKLANDPPEVRAWAWAPLVSQAGLTLGLAGGVARAFPELGTGFRALVVATAAVNTIAGPVLFKLALDRTGESRGPVPALPTEDEGEGKPA